MKARLRAVQYGDTLVEPDGVWPVNAWEVGDHPREDIVPLVRPRYADYFSFSGGAGTPIRRDLPLIALRAGWRRVKPSITFNKQITLPGRGNPNADIWVQEVPGEAAYLSVTEAWAPKEYAQPVLWSTDRDQVLAIAQQLRHLELPLPELWPVNAKGAHQLLTPDGFYEIWPAGETWQATVTRHGKPYEHLGYFDNPHDAWRRLAAEYASAGRAR